jgi:hypothetical protein
MTWSLGEYLPAAVLEQRFISAAATCGGVVDRIGTTVQGRAIHAVRVGAGRQKLLVTANLHGNEWVSALAALRLLERLANPDHPLRQAELVVVVCANPDGYAATEACAGQGPPGTLRKNANGVDLNRNFPWPGGTKPRVMFAASGSDNPQAATYRGPSEPETKALVNLAAEGFAGAIALHSFMGSLIPPLVHTAADRSTYRVLCRSFRAAQPTHRSFTLMVPWLDVYTGELDDHLHHVHGTWAVTVEIYPWWHSLRDAPREFKSLAPWFWRFNPRDPKPYVEDIVMGCEAMLGHMLRLPAP